MTAMKKIIRLLSIAAVAAVVFSCKGFLDENPTTSLSESTVYSTESSLEA